MPKNKRPIPRKAHEMAQDKDDLVAQSLADLALDLVEQEDSETSATMSAQLGQKEIDFHKLIRKTLNQKKDDVLYDAIERAKDADVGAYQYLRSNIEELSATVFIRQGDAPEMEINAFVIPMFVHSTGGLVEADGFQDQEAFDALVRSFQSHELESAKAKVVLINHAYDLHEIDRITYSDLNEMVRDAWASMTDKKITALPALERSMAGWSATDFGADDTAVELRFLLGFALKRTDDPFYQAPPDAEAADAWFAARMQRYQLWTQQVAPMVQRCLTAPTNPITLNFLYQDLFHGGKEQGLAEYFMLQMMSGINQALHENGITAQQVHAIVGPDDVDGAMLMRVNLHAREGHARGTLLVSKEKPLDLAADLQIEVDDICDALTTIGIEAVAVALRLDADGHAQDVRPYQRQAH
ncbi:MAG: hypothetical protein ACI83P_002171 [Janthinobacterium sp.]|jgi:hypothetical protein